jgi:hypothetical protein
MWQNYGPQIIESAAREYQQNVEKAKKSTFDIGKIVPALITSIATANPTPLLLAGAGEGVRASTGSDMDIAGLAQQAGQQFMPQQVQGQSGMGALGTMPQSKDNAFMQMLAQSGKLPMESFEHGGVKYKRENYLDQLMNSPVGGQLMEMMTNMIGGGQGGRKGAGPKIQAPAAYEAVEQGTGKRIVSDDGKNWRYAE